MAGKQLGSASRDVRPIGLLLIVASLAWLQFFPLEEVLDEDRTTARGSGSSLVVIDPGHGGVDSGAICAGVLEKDLTLDVAQRVRASHKRADFKRCSRAIPTNIITRQSR